MKEIMQPGLFDPKESGAGQQEQPCVKSPETSPSSYDPSRHYSEAAIDQGWGWQPPEVTVEAALEHEAQLDKNLTEQPPDTWQPPTEAEKEHIRFMIETAKARLRQKRQ